MLNPHIGNSKKRRREECSHGNTGDPDEKPIEEPLAKRFYGETGQCLQFLEKQEMIDVSGRTRERKHKTPDNSMMKTRCASEAQQRMVIYLRFQSLTSMERRWKTPKEVFYQTGIS
jgi:hypothetical protein